MLKKIDPNGLFGFILTVIFSLFFVFYTLGWTFISGHASYWDIETNDITQHLSSLNLYLSSPWQFPLLGFDGLNYPVGTRVTFVDGIPVLAFLLKIVLPRHIGYINPMGYWVALTFILQGVSAWWITKELQVKSWGYLAFVFLVFMTYPAFLDRLWHVALMSHWIILFSIALYLRGNRLNHLVIKGWTALLFFSFYIHIYLFAMALGIYLAAVFEIKQKLTWRYVFVSFLPFIILGASLFLFLLPLASDSIHPQLDYDTFAMNLLSPFSGGKLIMLQADLTHTPRGLNYLGLGVILIFLWVAFSQLSKNFETFKKHWAFFLIMSLYFLYSLSSKIYFGGHLIATVEYPDCLMPIITQLRGTGRFFWPVGYTIVIFSTYILYSQFRNKYVFTSIIGALFVIQCADISDYYHHFQEKHHPYSEEKIKYSVLDEALGKGITYIYLYPTCFREKNYTYQVLLPIERYVAVRQLKLNTGFIARYTPCRNTLTEIAQSNKKESAYLFSKLKYKNLNQVYEEFKDTNNLTCQNLDTLYVCRFQTTVG